MRGPSLSLRLRDVLTVTVWLWPALLFAEQEINQAQVVYESQRIEYPNGYRALVLPNPLPWPWEYSIDFAGVGRFSNSLRNGEFDCPRTMTFDEVWQLGGLEILGYQTRPFWEQIYP